jgi:hypothetical protein
MQQALGDFMGGQIAQAPQGQFGGMGPQMANMPGTGMPGGAQIAGMGGTNNLGADGMGDSLGMAGRIAGGATSNFPGTGQMTDTLGGHVSPAMTQPPARDPYSMADAGRSAIQSIKNAFSGPGVSPSQSGMFGSLSGAKIAQFGKDLLKVSQDKPAAPQVQAPQIQQRPQQPMPSYDLAGLGMGGNNQQRRRKKIFPAFGTPPYGVLA